jgi:DNA-binding SARP family transcriptional activator
MRHMRWRVLGPVEAAVHGKVILDRRPQQRGLIAYLLLNANRLVATGHLVEALWGVAPPPTARTQVHASVSRIRRALRDHRMDPVLISRQGGYLLTVESGELDLAEFHRAVEAARAATRTTDLPGAADLYRQALDHWRGTPLTGAAGAFVEAASARLEDQRLSAWEDLVDTELALGRHAAVIDDLLALVAAHPLRERLVAQLMRALAARGQQAQALSVYAGTRSRLADELGVQPGQELADVHVRVLRQQVPVASPARSPRRVGVAPTRAHPRPAQLPADLPVFAGRAEPLRRLHALLPTDPAARLRSVAVTGMAGVGKTALAVHWAHRIAHRFPDGQLYSDLRGFHPTQSPLVSSDVLRGFLTALGLPPRHLPSDMDALAALYRSMLTDLRVLVVLDSARDPDQIRPLLPGSASCLVLITSRHQLTSMVAAAAVDPLVLDPLSDDEARHLLASRLGADRVVAEPHAVDQIITLAAGLPLALSLAAARAAGRPTVGLRCLAQEMHASSSSLDAFASPDPAADLRVAFATSYAVLSPAAAAMFSVIGLLETGDFDLATAARRAGLSTGRTRHLLAELSQASLISEPASGMFRIHDLCRAYAIDIAAGRGTGATSVPPAQRRDASGARPAEPTTE